MEKQALARLKKRVKEERASARRDGRILMTEVIATMPHGVVVTPKSNILDPNRKLYSRPRDKRAWQKERY